MHRGREIKVAGGSHSRDELQSCMNVYIYEMYDGLDGYICERDEAGH